MTYIRGLTGYHSRGCRKPMIRLLYRVSYLGYWRPGPWFNIKMSSYQYRKSHCGDKTILRPSYLHNGISYTGKTTSLYWIRALTAISEFDAFCLYYSFRKTDPITHTSLWYDWCERRYKQTYFSRIWDSIDIFIVGHRCLWDIRRIKHFRSQHSNT